MYSDREYNTVSSKWLKTQAWLITRVPEYQIELLLSCPVLLYLFIPHCVTGFPRAGIEALWP